MEYAKQNINQEKVDNIEKQTEKPEEPKKLKEPKKPKKPKESKPKKPKTFQSFFEKFSNFISNLTESKYFKKLCKKISLYTHPDKTNNKFLHQLFLESQKSFEKKQYFMLVIIASLLGIKSKLHNKEKNLLNKDKKNIINYRKQILQNIVYSYDKLPIKQKRQVIINCLQRGCLDVDFKNVF